MNIYDIAKLANVSPATVSRVINNRGNVKEDTANKIKKIIENTGYIPSATARNLSVGVSKNIAFIVPDIENPFFSKILHGISDRASYYNYNVFMFGSDENIEKEHRILKSLSSDMILGILVIPVSHDDMITAQYLKEFEEKGIPVVLIDRDIRNCSFHGVFSEDEDGAYQAVKCLIEEGHKDIAIITGPTTSRPGLNRLMGYQRALQEHGIPLREEYMVSGEFKLEESYHAAKKLFALNHVPTAIFTSNNLTTIGVLQFIRESGLKLVRDISLIGFDDIDYLNLLNIKVSIVDRPIYDMGYQAMDLLQNNYLKRDENRLITQRISAKTWLVKRGSEKHILFKGVNER